MASKKSNIKKNGKYVSSSTFTITTSILAAAVLALGGVLAWKLLTPTSGGGGDTPVDESVSTLTYDYSPYRENNNPIIYFEIPDENEEEPPFVGDVTIQWNKDDPSTKVKVEADAKNITFDYKEKYPNIDPREFTIVISGDVRTFSTVSGDNIEDDGNSYFTSISIGRSVTTIVPGAFNGVNYLHSVHIAGNVSKINSEAFCGCTNLQCVDFSTVNETDRLDIAYGCFMACDNLKTVHFPKRLTYLGPLKSCRSLEELTIPKDNEYYSTLYENDEGKMVESGMLVTKKDVKCPHFDEYIQYDDIDCKKDTVVASTIHPHIYEGIKAINSLSGADIKHLLIPSTVESINTHELAISHIDSICVAQGNQRYTDLYQTTTEEGEFKTANVLAELNNETSELSIIKVAKDATQIEEMGDIYTNNEPKSYPVTDIVYGAINNSDVTSLDLPSTLKTFNFDTLYDTAYFFNNNLNVNPFYKDLTDLTIRAINPPIYVPNEEIGPTFHISELFSQERTDRVNIHVPDSAVYNYASQVNEEDPSQPGYWNLNSYYAPDVEIGEIRFQYSLVDSETLSSREEAKQWVKEHYKSGYDSTFVAYSKWDFTPLAKLKDLSNAFFQKFKNILGNEFATATSFPRSFEKTVAGSVLPHSQKGGIDQVSIRPLNLDNFGEFFKMFTKLGKEDSQNDFVFSVHDGCLEAVQCPSAYEFGLTDGNDKYISGKVKRVMKFDNQGYITFSRLDIEDFTFVPDIGGEPYKLDDIYLSFEKFGLPYPKDDAITWANEHAEESAFVDKQSLNWSFAYNSNVSFTFDVVDESQSTVYNGISDFISKSVVSGEITVEDLYCEKNIPCIYSSPLEIEPISADDFAKIHDNSLYCISDDNNYLYIYERIEELSNYFAGISLTGKAVRLRKFNTNAICEHDAYYFFQNNATGSTSNPFSGYIEITNNFVE